MDVDDIKWQRRNSLKAIRLDCMMKEHGIGLKRQSGITGCSNSTTEPFGCIIEAND